MFKQYDVDMTNRFICMEIIHKDNGTFLKVPLATICLLFTYVNQYLHAAARISFLKNLQHTLESSSLIYFTTNSTFTTKLKALHSMIHK